MTETKRWHRLPSGILHGERPKWQCSLCPAVFFEGQQAAYISHVIGHPEEETRALSPRVQNPSLYDPDAGDAEWAKWIRDHAASDPHGWERWMRTDDGKSGGGIGDGS